MQVILGPFHPHLEDALVEGLLDHKKTNPLVSLLILVPSDSLRNRLKILLCRERGLNLLNLHVLTFFQLSLRLSSELRVVDAPELRDDPILEEALRQILRVDHSAKARFSSLEETAAGCSALWQTLRDLKDGMVDPSRALEALAEGHFGDESLEKISHLFSLFETFLSRCKEWGIGDYADLDTAVMGHVASSAFLRSFSHIFYYGFYDLTQVQIDIFHSLARQYPTTLFFPLFSATSKPPAWVFAERFYERYVLGLTRDSSQIRDLVSLTESPAAVSRTMSLFADETGGTSHLLPENFRCAIFSCFGARDEILTASKEILRLVDRGLDFSEIGVVARTLTPYSGWIKEIFDEHRIPIATYAEEPLVQSPLAKAALLLVNLPAKDYLRSTFMDLVSAPFFNLASFCPAGLTARPDLWDLLTRRLGITKGLAEWRRVEKHLNQDLALAKRDENDGSPILLDGSAAQLGILWRVFTELNRDLTALPDEGSWSQYVSAWRELFKKYLPIVTGGEDSAPGPEARVSEVILEQLGKLAQLDAVTPTTSLRYFLETYQRSLERSTIPIAEANLSGVSILDAMGARGIPFRALFILGLNEGLFPRTIREDAFLRDRDRRRLETVLGYKVSEKLASFDEEKLLFALLVGAAREHLYCLYQRADENGRALAPSWYLSEFIRALRRDQAEIPVKEINVPRAIADKRLIEPFTAYETLPPEEMAVSLSLSGGDPSTLVELLFPSAPIYQRGRRAMESMEDPAGHLTEYDGTVGPLPDYRARLDRQGIAPTALERFAQCPFQFYARNLLGLGRLEQPEEIASLEPSEIGRLCHSILRSVFQQLMEGNYFNHSSGDADWRTILEDAARKACADYETKNSPGYLVPWEVLKEELIELLAEVLAKDLQELTDSGFQPVTVEIDLQGALPWDKPANLKGLPIHGRLDRIDYHRKESRFRVVDYKYKMSGERSTPDGNLLLSAVRGQRLQPPFYVLLAKRFAAEMAPARPDSAVLAAFYFLAPKWKNGPLVVSHFAESGWEGQAGEQLKQTLSFLLEGIEQGQFFIQPGEYCDHCEVSEVCRKNHLPTYWRSERDPWSKVHRALRHQAVPKDATESGKKARPRRGRRT